ncbi:MAG: hypothetical protein AAGG48_05600 [Planctomycetota bacterium]
MNNETTPSRRRFLLGSAGLLVASTPATSAMGANGQKARLTAGNHPLFRVRIEMEVEGNVRVSKNPLVSRKSALSLPLKSEAVLDYEERYAAGRRPDQSLERFYHEAQSTSSLNGRESSLQLRPSVRDASISRAEFPEVVSSNEDYFRRDELDLLRVPASSVVVDQLLPDQPVAVGSKYKPKQAVLAALLNLSSVEASDVNIAVVSLDSKQAKFQIQGKVDGSVDGVPTVIRLVGKLTFDRRAKTCVWLAMGLHETREIGIAEPGFDVSAKVRMVRKPLNQTVALPKKRRSVPVQPSPQRLYVDLQSDELAIGALMDRNWRMMSDLPGTAMMRMTDRDRIVAQCDFRSLVALEPGVTWSMKSFQEDARRTLGEQLIEFSEAEQQTNKDGMTVLRLTANGEVQGVPVHWIMLHFSDESGRRVLATFTMEAEKRERFAGADEQLASSLRFTRDVTPLMESQTLRESPNLRESQTFANRSPDPAMNSDREISRK